MFPTLSDLGMNQRLKPVYNSETAPYSVHMRGVHKMKYPFLYVPVDCAVHHLVCTAQDRGHTKMGPVFTFARVGLVGI